MFLLIANYKHIINIYKLQKIYKFIHMIYICRINLYTSMHTDHK